MIGPNESLYLPVFLKYMPGKDWRVSQDADGRLVFQVGGGHQTWVTVARLDREGNLALAGTLTDNVSF